MTKNKKEFIKQIIDIAKEKNCSSVSIDEDNKVRFWFWYKSMFTVSAAPIVETTEEEEEEKRCKNCKFENLSWYDKPCINCLRIFNYNEKNLWEPKQ